MKCLCCILLNVTSLKKVKSWCFCGEVPLPGAICAVSFLPAVVHIISLTRHDDSYLIIDQCEGPRGCLAVSDKKKTVRKRLSGRKVGRKRDCSLTQLLSPDLLESPRTLEVATVIITRRVHVTFGQANASHVTLGKLLTVCCVTQD